MTSERREPRYRVAAVERMTGIPASTLRSWERRYGWPRPVRAPSGQRLYSDHDSAAGLPGELVTGGVDDGAATVDATMSRRR